MFVGKDVHFNERVVGLARPILLVENFFRGTVDKPLIFISLLSETNDSTKFTYADTNPTLALVSYIHTTPSLPQLSDTLNSTTSHLAPHFQSNATGQTTENEINASSNSTADNQPSNATLELSNRIPTISDYISTAHNQPSNTCTVSNDATNNNAKNNIPNTFDDLDINLSNAPSPSILEDSETSASQRSMRNGVNQVDYKKFLKRGKAAAVKTNSSVLLNIYIPKPTAFCLTIHWTIHRNNWLVVLFV